MAAAARRSTPDRRSVRGTLHPEPPDEQARFATLLGRLDGRGRRARAALDARRLSAPLQPARGSSSALCDPHAARSPTGAALRRAVDPTSARPAVIDSRTTGWSRRSSPRSRASAARCPCWRSPLARLWEKRDRETGLLTRQAYHDIGGVGGALARHAEATVDRIGVERIPIVRELFRNLVTAEGTRAVREWDELLSVFERPSPERSGLRGRGVEASPQGRKRADVRGQRLLQPRATCDPADSIAQVQRGDLTRPCMAAEDVLRQLIDARLLTSYEVREDEHEPDPPGRDHPRVAARQLAAPRSLADSGRRRRSAPRPAPSGGHARGTSTTVATTRCGPDRPIGSSRSGANTIPAVSPRSRRRSPRP